MFYMQVLFFGHLKGWIFNVERNKPFAHSLLAYLEKQQHDRSKSNTANWIYSLI